MSRPSRLRSWLFPSAFRLTARIVAKFGPAALSLGRNCFVFRWQDVSEVLSRKGDFIIAQVNGTRIDAISSPSEAASKVVAHTVFHETFLDLSGDTTVWERGIATGRELTNWILVERERRLATGAIRPDMLGALLAAEQVGQLPRFDLSAILAGLLVGVSDTAATAVTHVVNEALRVPLLGVGILADAAHPERLSGGCRGALRRDPRPVSGIISDGTFPDHLWVRLGGTR